MAKLALARLTSSRPSGWLQLPSAEISASASLGWGVALAALADQGELDRARVGEAIARYRIDADVPLRHPLEAHCRIGDLLAMVGGGAPPAADDT